MESRQTHPVYTHWLSVERLIELIECRTIAREAGACTCLLPHVSLASCHTHLPVGTPASNGALIHLLQCGAVLCSVLQCGAVLCSVLQCFAVWCSALQCVAVLCSVLQCGAVLCSVLQCFAVWCSALQCVAVWCSALQCVAVLCSVLQCFAVWCSALQSLYTSLAACSSSLHCLVGHCNTLQQASRYTATRCNTCRVTLVYTVLLPR